MSHTTEARPRIVALIGNPNTGKSTLFGALVGIHQHVGNYPGVTVEKKTGQMYHGGQRYELIDLPGLYSLAPRSRDEMVTVDVLLGRYEDSPVPDAVICVVDASNLQRNLYLAGQVLEFGLPTVLAVNMMDVAKRHDVRLKLDRLAKRLGIPVIPVQANRQVGLDEVQAALAQVVKNHTVYDRSPFPEVFEREVEQLETAAEDLSPCLIRRLLLDSNGYLERALLDGERQEVGEQFAAARSRLAEAGCAIPGVETEARYGWAGEILDGVISQPSQYLITATDRLDRVLTNRFWGTLLFAAVMVLVFQAVFAWAVPLMDLIDAGCGAMGDLVAAWLPEGMVRSLAVDGIIGGVGGVLVFLPQILILFLFIAILEDCGYMARAAFLMDRLMARVGLSGRSFIPMLSCFACAIPGIMAARVIENERDRLTTILVAPLMTCSARLPVYALLIAAFIPPTTCLGGYLSLQALTLLSLYALGIVTAVVMAMVFKRTILRGRTPPFLMELPSYKWPSPRTVIYRVFGRAWIFLRTAGTLILVVSMLVWAALYFPHDQQAVEGPFEAERTALLAEAETLDTDDPRSEQVAARLAQIDGEIRGEYQRQSLLGQAGQFIEPVVRPLGWDWRIGCAVIASFPAREIVVATMGVIYNLGEDVDVESEEDVTRFHARLHEATWDGSDPPRRVFNIPVALSVMVFFALCAQCAATLAVIRRETNSWRWPVFTFTYMTVLAYIGALITYRLGMWIAG